MLRDICISVTVCALKRNYGLWNLVVKFCKKSIKPRNCDDGIKLSLRTRILSLDLNFSFPTCISITKGLSNHVGRFGREGCGSAEPGTVLKRKPPSKIA